ncbi:LodA/GoxA family CTQ-dependent oxidase [Corallococcus macrosporus]|uniref:L-lysine 6-oxidase n=1 Tax=Corallococcus macrosporus DSM 14697 TaxID=1189310 RepID=A0A250JPX2_9BACT|nr:LodA/GoxA family CTQ-dependent oxidase [Corallococcus macrosporus]ATB45431.1 hypothetical protein MYMAC_001016 [Corallococcus macrosporus DSM 14697]
MSTTYKIHPAIGVARVGDSEDYYLGPEEAGGLPLEVSGGPVTRFRDANLAVRRQAARFQIHAYDASGAYLSTVQVGERGVKDIRWTVHLANKKAAWYEFRQQQGADGNYAPQGNPPKPHPLRNPRTLGDDRNALILDAGPRTVTCRGTGGWPTTADCALTATSAHPSNLLPEGSDITRLGKLVTDAQGHLHAVGGYGKAGVSVHYDLTSGLLEGWEKQHALAQDILQALKSIADIGYATQESFDAAVDTVLADPSLDLGGDQQRAAKKFIHEMAYPQPRLDTYANNTFWWDDVSDGPVTATLVMEDDSEHEVEFPAWVVVGPPGYAPQILNIITLYDTLYDTFVTQKNLAPSLYQDGQFQTDYTPNFQAELLPILSRPAVYQWVADVGPTGNGKHDAIQGGNLGPRFLHKIRNPSDVNVLTPDLMPKMAGDNPITETLPRKFLTLTRTQYFFLKQYSDGKVDHSPPRATASPGALLDRAVLENCVGGAFCPGIEMTWIARDGNFFQDDPDAGFRFKHRVRPEGQPLQWDVNPHDGLGLEPGDASKYMALPWQADFNECSNQPVLQTSLWWWPAQRPYYVNYLGDDQQWHQDYWTRPAPSNFDVDEDMVFHWNELGFVIKRSDAPANERGPDAGPGMPPAPTFIEVERTYKPDPSQQAAARPKAGHT